MQIKSASNSGLFIFSAFLAVGLWGFFSIPLRSLNQYPADLILCYRILVSMICLGLFQIIFNKKRMVQDWTKFKSLPKIETRRWVIISLVSSILITLNWYSYIFVINRVNIQSAAFAYMVCPLMTALAAFLFLKEHISFRQKWALFIALTAVLMLATHYFHDVLWSFLVAIWYSLYLVLQKISPDIEKGFFLLIQFIFSSIFLLPYFIFFHPIFPTETHFWFMILIISILFTIVPLYLSLFSLQVISSTTMGIIMYFNPLVAFGVAILYFHEQLNYFKVFSYFLVLLAVILFNWTGFGKSKLRNSNLN